MRLIYTEKGQELREELLRDKQKEAGRKLMEEELKQYNSALLEEKKMHTRSNQHSRESDEFNQLMPIRESSIEQSNASNSQKGRRIGGSMMNTHSLPKIYNTTEQAMEQCDFLISVKVNKPKVKVSPTFQSKYDAYSKKETPQNSNVWRKYGYSPLLEHPPHESIFNTMETHNSDDHLPPVKNTSLKNYNSQVNRNLNPMFGSLRLQIEEENPIELMQKQKQSVFHYPSITQDILSNRIIPGKLQQTPSELKLHSPARHFSNPRKLDGSPDSQKKGKAKNLYESEMDQNRIGKAMVRQQEQENNRLQVAKKIMARAEYFKNSIQPVNQVDDLAPPEQQQLDRIVRSRAKERYRDRVMKNVDKRYGKYWYNHQFHNFAHQKILEKKNLDILMLEMANR